MSREGLARTVLNILSKNHILSCYTFRANELSEEVLDSFEKNMMYNGYSVAWHMLYPVYYAYEAGVSVCRINKRIPTLLARVAILQDLYDNVGNLVDRVHKKDKKALVNRISEAETELAHTSERKMKCVEENASWKISTRL